MSVCVLDDAAESMVLVVVTVTIVIHFVFIFWANKKKVDLHECYLVSSVLLCWYVILPFFLIILLRAVKFRIFEEFSDRVWDKGIKECPKKGQARQDDETNTDPQ